MSDIESKYDHSSFPFEDNFPNKAKEERGEEGGGEKLTQESPTGELGFHFLKHYVYF